MAEVIIGSGAEADFADSLSWYAERSTAAAEGFQSAVDRALELIAEEPDRFPQCDKRHRYCRLKRYPFLVIYRPLEDDRILIVAVAHFRRRPRYWSKR